MARQSNELRPEEAAELSRRLRATTAPISAAGFTIPRVKKGPLFLRQPAPERPGQCRQVSKSWAGGETRPRNTATSEG
jgi:hypothetical protein